jgi:PAS domain S-box-containing protein
MNVTTESRQSEEAPGESEAKFRLLFEKSPDAMLLLDGDVFVDCNLAAVGMMDCSSKEQLLALRPYDISPERQPDGRLSVEKARDLTATAFREGSLRFEWVHRAVDGTDFPVEVLLTTISLRGRKVLHVAWRDISERKRAEEVPGYL